MNLDAAYLILNKPPRELSLEDLRSLVGVEEADRLEFKEEAYDRNDKGTREKVANKLADRLWNAFGFNCCPLFDENGRFKP